MKVLFAINTESTVKQIMEFYKNTYGEKIENTNVYFFRSLLDTLKKNKNGFDRIVIHEELEPVGTKNQDVLDKYIFNNVDKITDEAGKAEIIFICGENRRKDDKLLSKMFNIGIYNILIGDERTIGKVSELINKPRTKKDAKRFLEVDIEGITYEDPNKVDEKELRSTIKYFETHINERQTIINGFESLYEQYTIEKLRYIINFLPSAARSILAEESEKYTAIMGMPAPVKPIVKYVQEQPREVVKVVEVPVYVNEEKPKKQEEKIEPAPVVEPPKMKMPKVEPPKEEPVVEPPKIEIPKVEPVVEPPKVEVPKVELVVETPKIEVPKVEPVVETPKIEVPKVEPVVEPPKIEVPKVEPVVEAPKIEVPKVEPVVEPPKVEVPKVEPVVEPPKIEVPKAEPVVEPPKIEVPKAEPVVEPPKVEIPKVEPVVAPPRVEPTRVEPVVIPPNVQPQQPMGYTPRPEPQIQTVTQVIEREVIKEVYETPRDYKKAVCFIGAHKTGTTFLINSIANTLANKGVKTAILDLTKNKDSYMIYAAHDSENRDTAANSLANLAMGQNVPYEVGNLSIYTGLPRVDRTKYDCLKILEIVKRTNSVVLIDCDFTTPIDVFRLVNNIYVVQDMDVLNVLPITMFLKELKARDVDLFKVEIIINKFMKSVISVSKIIENMVLYSNPEMTFIEELLPRNVKRFVIPFDEQNYLRYLEGLFNSRLNFSGYSEEFKQAMATLVQSIFPVNIRGAAMNTPSDDGGGFLKNMFGKRR